jgi:hypothetical protein
MKLKDSNVSTNVTPWRMRETICGVEEQQAFYIFRVCVCSLNTKRLHRIIMPSVACPALTYFSTLSHKRNDFPEKGF